MVKSVGSKNKNEKYLVYNQDKKTYYTAKTFYEICNIEDKTLEQIRHQYKTYKYSGNFKTKFNENMLIITKLKDEDEKIVNQKLNNTINRIKEQEQDDKKNDNIEEEVDADADATINVATQSVDDEEHQVNYIPLPNMPPLR